jgi:hypothetical protein
LARGFTRGEDGGGAIIALGTDRNKKEIPRYSKTLHKSVARKEVVSGTSNKTRKIE